MNINQVWPEWNEECVLGEGSFGKVYRAKRVEYGRVFYSAIKVLTVPKSQQEIKAARAQGMNDNDIYAYFRGLVDNLLNEITLMDNLKGAKNIVGIEDYKIIEHQGEIGWDIFIRMELLTPFDSFVSNPEFSHKDVIRLGVDICNALEICEQNCIVHRDIKPDNIFISRFGEYKLGDFGIARKLEVTQANFSRKGTLNYMAPEVYKSEEYGANVDIYSLGLVLYTLLNNNRTAFLPQYPQPITFKDNEDALGKRLSGEPMLPPCNASASLSAAILKACAYRPQDRYQSATEFKNALIKEWNVIVQSGDNQEIKSDAMRFDSDLDQKLQRTTNDMTVNGRLVVDAYAQGTTVLDQNGVAVDSYIVGSVVSSTMGGNCVGEMPFEAPVVNATAKSSKFCRVLAWPMALGVCVLAVWLLSISNALFVQTVSVCLMGVGLTILVAPRNKRAVGICVLSLSFVYILWTMLDSLLLRHRVMPLLVVYALAGLLMFLGGIVILLQKEVRFGGTLNLYAVVVEWIYNVYQMLNRSFNIDMWRVFFAVAAMTVFVWSYGYKSDARDNTIQKALNVAVYVLAAAVVLQAVAYAAVVFTNM